MKGGCRRRFPQAYPIRFILRIHPFMTRFCKAIWAFLFVVSIVPTILLEAQPSRWTTHTALREIVDLTASPSAIWAATTGGVFRYQIDSGEIARFTTTEGLYGLNIRSVAYDAVNQSVWVGYQDGVLDRIETETGEVQSFLDIQRASQFPSRDIQKLSITGDTLVVATSLFVVLFNTNRGEVIETYSRFGNIESDATLQDVTITTAPDGVRRLWVAIGGMLAYAPIGAANLQDPSVWQTETLGAGTMPVQNIAGFEGNIYAGTENGLFIRDAANQYRLLDVTSGSILSLIPQEDLLIAIEASSFIVIRNSDEARRIGSGGLLDMRDLVEGPDGSYWVGDFIEGLSAFAPFTFDISTPAFTQPSFFPDGPFDGQFTELDFDREGNLWLGGVRGTERGFYKLDTEGNWTNYIKRFYPDLVGKPTQYEYIHNDAQGNFWAGSNGAGLLQLTPNDEIIFHNQTNSTLREALGAPGTGFTIVRGIASERDGTVWVANTGAAQPLHVRLLDGTWTGFPSVAGSAVTYQRIYADSFGQKWIVMVGQNNLERQDGLIVLDSGSDVSSPADDTFRIFSEEGSNGQGLPGIAVNAIEEDKAGRVWLATSEGLAYFVNTGIIASDPNAVPLWPIRATRQPGESQFLFFGLKINDLAIDPANNLWVATDVGAWYVEEIEGGFQDAFQLTAENSPLLSNVILSIDVDERTGEVYFSTDLGLISLQGEALAPTAEKQDLFIYPNPARLEEGSTPDIFIEGLLDETDVRILTVDGTLVASIAARGGRVRWDGRDRNNQLVPSGMYLVIAVDRNGEGAAHGKVAVIR